MGEALTAGTVVENRYVLEARLGEGTFGDVWRARDTRLSGRAVAIKFLKAEHTRRSELIARFDAEADALAMLQHPHVVSVSDRGSWQEMRYLVTELIEGESLAAWLERHRVVRTLPELRDVAALFEQICAGVEAAHAVRSPGAIVHRDLKPDNVLIRALPGGDQAAKVLDFGIAQLGGRKGTRTGALMGTPLYMAPEQAMGLSAGVGPWSDVFSLAVILVEMLTLRASGGDDEPWWGIAMQSTEALRATLGRLRVDVPASVWDVIARAMRPKGGDRIQDAGALRKALRVAWGTGGNERPSVNGPIKVGSRAPEGFEYSPTMPSLSPGPTSALLAAAARVTSGAPNTPDWGQPARPDAATRALGEPRAAQGNLNTPSPLRDPTEVFADPSNARVSPVSVSSALTSPSPASGSLLLPPAHASLPGAPQQHPSPPSTRTSKSRRRRSGSLGGLLIGVALGAAGLLSLGGYLFLTRTPPRAGGSGNAAGGTDPMPSDDASARAYAASTTPDAGAATAADGAAVALVADGGRPNAQIAGGLFAPPVAAGSDAASGAGAATGAAADAPLASNPEVLNFLERWRGAVVLTGGTASIADLYTEHPRFRAAGRVPNTGVIQGYWSRFFRVRSTLEFDWNRSTWSAEPPDREASAAPFCDELPGASGPVVKVRAWATENVPARSAEVGCTRLEGVYLFRLRRVGGAYRICYETWSTREGLCASCPTARACQHLDVDMPPP